MVRKDKKVERINATMARKLISAGGELKLETITIDGQMAWRVNVHVPDDPAVYRVIIYHTMKDKYFKSVSAGFAYFLEMMPEGSRFTIETVPSEDIAEDS